MKHLKRTRVAPPAFPQAAVKHSPNGWKYWSIVLPFIAKSRGRRLFIDPRVWEALQGVVQPCLLRAVKKVAMRSRWRVAEHMTARDLRRRGRRQRPSALYTPDTFGVWVIRRMVEDAIVFRMGPRLLRERRGRRDAWIYSFGLSREFGCLSVRGLFRDCHWHWLGGVAVVTLPVAGRWGPRRIATASRVTAATAYALWRRFPRVTALQMALVRAGDRERRRLGGIKRLARSRPIELKLLLTYPNAELRRTLVELRGLALGKGVRAIDSSKWGTLYKLLAVHRALSGAANDVRVLKVKCPSTGREYLLPVPSEIRTARAAYFWTFHQDTAAEGGGATVVAEA